MPDYLYTVTMAGKIHADTPAEAEALAYQMVDGGFAEVVGCEVELLGEGEGRMSAPQLLYFACDRCMNRWSAYRASECPACGHGSVWEFERESNRDQYVHDHERLFRRV